MCDWAAFFVECAADTGSGGTVFVGGGLRRRYNHEKADELNQPVQYTDAETVKHVQEYLNKGGYMCEPDGKYGPNTASQIKLYETANRLDDDGIITDELLKAMKIEPTEEAKTLAEKASFRSDLSWEEFARNPSDYYDVKAKFSGRILQADPSDSSFGNRWARMAVDDNIDTVFYITVPAELLTGRLLENDYVTVYGEGNGSETYIAVLGNEITIPELEVHYIEIN